MQRIMGSVAEADCLASGTVADTVRWRRTHAQRHHRRLLLALLLLLQQIGLAPRDAAVVMLSGQVADGLMTILVGEMIDRFGRFKSWHIGGSVVAVSFSSVFRGCLLCTILVTDSYLVRTVGYSFFAVVFNTQVSHMSMVN